MLFFRSQNKTYIHQFMRNIIPVLLVLLLSLSGTAQNTNLIENMVSVLNEQSVSSMTSLLNKEGYSEESSPVFAQKNLKVFKKKATRGEEAYILEYCGSSLTGYYTTLSRMENVILMSEAEKKGYKHAEDNYYKYYNGDVSLEVVSDRSVVNRFGQSDAFGKATDYVHVARKSSCGASPLALPGEKQFNFHPGSLDECLKNIRLTKSEVLITMAKSAFFTGATDAANGVEQYVKDGNGITVQYCEGVLKAFGLLVPKSDGKGVEADLKAKGYKMSQEKTGEKNSYSRAYETDGVAVVLTYYGDVADEDNREYAYQLLVARKNTTCK